MFFLFVWFCLFLFVFLCCFCLFLFCSVFVGTVLCVVLVLCFLVCFVLLCYFAFLCLFLSLFESTIPCNSSVLHVGSNLIFDFCCWFLLFEFVCLLVLQDVSLLFLLVVFLVFKHTIRCSYYLLPVFLSFVCFLLWCLLLFVFAIYQEHLSKCWKF